MSSDCFELITLKSGLTSLRLLSNGETFHPGIGPEAEARMLHVGQQDLVARSRSISPLIIWDVGLGAAANAIAALEALADVASPVEMHSFDHTLAPLRFACDHSEYLVYIQPYRKALETLMSQGHVRVGQVNWYLHCADFRQSMSRSDLPAPHAIFYDPYSQASNAEMWTLEHFTKLRQRLDDNRPCLLTNYSRSTAVRSTWLLAGFYVGIGVGIGAKDQTSLASNDIRLLQQPLSLEWLKKVPASQNANPLREGGSGYGRLKVPGSDHVNLLIGDGNGYGRMSAADFEKLKAHPQFQTEAP